MESTDYFVMFSIIGLYIYGLYEKRRVMKRKTFGTLLSENPKIKQLYEAESFGLGEIS